MLKVLLKTRLQALLTRFSSVGMTPSKKALTRGAAIAWGLLSLGASAAIMFGAAWLLKPFYTFFSGAGLEWLFYGMGGLLATVITFVFTMFYAQGAIFEARDNEMLLSMPIRPSAILASRMGSLFLLTLAMIVSLMGGVGIARLQAGPATAGGVVIFTLAVLLLPFISATFACLLGWIVSMITRRMRRRALFQLVFSLAFLVGLYIVYRNINSYMQQLMDSSRDVAVAVRNVLPPFYFMGMAISGRDIPRLLAFAGCCVVPFAVLYLILSKTFIRIVTSRSGAKTQEYKKKALRSSPVVLALAKKDLSRFLNSSSYMLNAGLGILLAVAAGAVVLFSGAKMLLGIMGVYTDEEKAMDMLPLLGNIVMGFAASLAYLSAPSISVENKSLWIMKSMPISGGQALRSKLLFHLIPTLPAALLAAVMFLAATGIRNAATAVSQVLVPPLLMLFSGEFGLIMNLYLHRFNYQSESSAVKNSASSVVTMLVVMVFALFPVAFFFLPDDLALPAPTVMLIHTGVLAVLCLGMWLYLNSSAAERKWNSL